MKILAIETSCDETAAAVIGVQGDEPVVFSNIISSQVDLHAKTGGVVPEVASRAHMEAIFPIVEEALKAGKRVSSSASQQKTEDLMKGITHIAVTSGPGLIGSLLVGFNTAKAIAYTNNLPLLPINHIEGHIYSTITNTRQDLENNSSNDGKFPVLALTVSGGHSSLTMVRDHLKYETLGETIDDAAGEAFDKVAKLLKLGYPGGPAVSKYAVQFRDRIVNSELRMMDKSCNSEFRIHNSNIQFPRPLISKPNFDFSFSGLKTAVLTEVLKLKAKNSRSKGSPSGLTAFQKEEICFAFEEAVIDLLVTKTIRAARKYRPVGIILAGGVAANQRLREELKNRIEKYNGEVEEKYKTNFYTPGAGMSGDNAAMIGLSAYYHILDGEKGNWRDANVDSNFQIKNL